jgi:hypothetical protein
MIMSLKTKIMNLAIRCSPLIFVVFGIVVTQAFPNPSQLEPLVCTGLYCQ